MKTDDLIGLLAADAAPVMRHRDDRRLAFAVLVGAALGLLWVLAGLGPRPDLAVVAGSAPFAAKLGMPLAVAVLGGLTVFRLAHPGMRLGPLAPLAALPVLLLWAVAAGVWFGAAEEDRMTMIWGATWRLCSLNVALTSLPALVLSLWYLRGMAPTRPGWAGAAAGWLAGGLGAAAYALHCPEMAPPFLAVWYVLGMLVPTALGALAGLRWLRW